MAVARSPRPLSRTQGQPQRKREQWALASVKPLAELRATQGSLNLVMYSQAASAMQGKTPQELAMPESWRGPPQQMPALRQAAAAGGCQSNGQTWRPAAHTCTMLVSLTVGGQQCSRPGGGPGGMLRIRHQQGFVRPMPLLLCLRCSPCHRPAPRAPWAPRHARHRRLDAHMAPR